jgi:hypothetical protein
MTGRRMLLAVALLAAAMGLGLSDVALANDKCLVNTLRGLYVFSATGFTIPAAPASAQPLAVVEFLRFNGDGTLDVPGATLSLNGVITQIPGGVVTGSYTLAPLVPADRGCVGTLTILPFALHFDLFIPLSGQEIRIIQTDANNVLQGTATKLSN